MEKTVATLVYGAGISGCGVAMALAKQGAKVILYNDEYKEIPAELVEALTATGGSYQYGGDFALWLEQVDEVVMSPGIALTCPLAQVAQVQGIPIVGEVEIAYRIFPYQWIGITGTNGKTTTTTLVGEMMDTLPVHSCVGGNIGKALSLAVEELTPEDWVVAELSSFQLETVATFAPHIALILNITPDHLERHGTMEAYGAAKRNIYAHQTAQDYLVLNYDDATVREFATEAQAQICYISRKIVLEQGVFVENGKFVIKWQGEKHIVCQVADMHIFGSHNEENALGAIACAFFAGVAIEDISQVLQSFQGVEHRLEYVTTINGVAYYNDSKATNTDSTVKALEAFSGHIILLAGGHDKLTELDTMMTLVKEKVDTLILLGEAKERFYAASQKAGVEQVVVVDTFEEAVEQAYALAKEPQVVVLSPACSSYDMFDNFPQRGRYFKKLVQALAVK